MIQKRYLYLGHTVKLTENPFLSGGWAVECDTASIPQSIARLLALCATHNFENVKVDGQAIDYVGLFTSPNTLAAGPSNSTVEEV